MAFDCPQTITLDGARCELFDRFTESDFGGLLKTEVCSYRCDDGTYYSRWINRFCCLRGRFHSHVFRPDQAVHVIAVRTWALRQPVQITMTEAYAGCRSWVSLDEEIDIQGSRPVLSDSDLQAKIEEVSASLPWN